MVRVVGKVHLWSIQSKVKLVVGPTFPHPGVDDWSIKPWVSSNKEKQVSFLHPINASVQELVQRVVTGKARFEKKIPPKLTLTYKVWHTMIS